MKTTWMRWSVVVALGVAVLAWGAYAQDDAAKGAGRQGAGNRMDPQQMFSRMDADKDGKISEEEFLARAKQQFKMMDKDKDGKLSSEEMAAQRPTGRALAGGANQDPAKADKGGRAKKNADNE